MSDDIKIKVWVQSGLHNSKRETVVTEDRETWEEMSDEERDEAMKEIMFTMIVWDYESLG
ncbi:MAG: hypothetical protein GWN00_01060 [Aliifodinibius sp.]|nr:hypothetical protein [Fodinibius sp.]NIV09920.1 hypothetical protein [Fodinibius sp.]NIY23450.1 hypothetical protein [Fodinibius sp.]